jgi:hypothetical protein
MIRTGRSNIGDPCPQIEVRRSSAYAEDDIDMLIDQQTHRVFRGYTTGHSVDAHIEYGALAGPFRFVPHALQANLGGLVEDAALAAPALKQHAGSGLGGWGSTGGNG